MLRRNFSSRNQKGKFERNYKRIAKILTIQEALESECSKGIDGATELQILLIVDLENLISEILLVDFNTVTFVIHLNSRSQPFELRIHQLHGLRSFNRLAVDFV